MIGKFDSSSKICHFCGYRNSELTLKYREWKCPDRKTKHDSGINSVINIKKLSIIDQNLIGIWRPWNVGDVIGTILKKEQN